MKIAMIALAFLASSTGSADTLTLSKYCGTLANAGLAFHTMAAQGTSYYDARAKVDADPPPEEDTSRLIYLGLTLGYASYEQKMSATQAYESIYEACTIKYKGQIPDEDSAKITDEATINSQAVVAATDTYNPTAAADVPAKLAQSRDLSQFATEDTSLGDAKQLNVALLAQQKAELAAQYDAPVGSVDDRRIMLYIILSMSAAFGLVLLMSKVSKRMYGKPELAIAPPDAVSSQPELKVGHNKASQPGIITTLLSRILGISVFLAYLAYGITLLVAGYHGIDGSLGVVLATLAIAAAIIFQFTLPITIGAYFGTMEVWGWDWYWSLLFVAPGLAFLIPGFIVAATAWVIERPNARQTR